MIFYITILLYLDLLQSLQNGIIVLVKFWPTHWHVMCSIAWFKMRHNATW